MGKFVPSCYNLHEGIFVARQKPPAFCGSSNEFGGTDVTIFKDKKSKEQTIVQIAIDEVFPSPFQPRKTFDEDKLLELSQSIKENGILQPLTVRKVKNGYELVAGERRLKASKIAGLETVPCIVCDYDDTQSAVFAVLENLQRNDLNFFEEAEGISQLINTLGLTQEEVARRLGKSQPAIANKLRILKICDRQKQIIIEAGLTERHARALLKIDSTELRDRTLAYVVLKKFNVAQTEDFIRNLLENTATEKKKERLVVVRDVRLFANTIQKAIVLMQQSGIDAQSTKREGENFIEYVVRIPKSQGYKVAKSS